MKNSFKIITSLILCLLIFSGCTSPRDGEESTRIDSGTEFSVKTEPDSSAVTDEATKAPLVFAKEPLEIELSAPQAFVYNLDTDEFLYLRGEGEPLSPASTTKLLTITYAMTLLSPDELITPGDELSLVGEFSTYAYVRPIHTLSAEMLIEGMLLPSGNDAAHVLAAAAGRKLTDDKNISGVDAVGLFIDGMNEYAASIGMYGSHFVSPDGYPNDNHYSTVEDMALISVIAAKNELITKYSRLRKDDVTYASGHIITWTNTNKLIDPQSGYYSPYVTGLKTGSAGEGNYSLVVSANIEGVTYVFGFFSEAKADARFADALAVIRALEDRL